MSSATATLAAKPPHDLGKFLGHYGIFMIIALLAAPFDYAWFLGRYFRTQMKNKTLGNILFVSGYVFSAVVTIFFYLYWLEYFEIITIEVIPFANVLWWSVEIFHFAILILFIYCLYRVIRYKLVPYSAFYISVYQGAHVAYGGCPITEVQNWITARGGPFEIIPNTFWRGIFGEYDGPARLFFAVIVGIFVALSYIQFKRLGYGRDKWLDFWLEPELNQYQEV